MDDRLFKDGSREFSQRESIEEYSATVVPVFHEYVARISQRTGADPFLSDKGSMTNLPEGGNLYLASVVFDAVLPCEEVAEIGNEYFSPLGFAPAKITQKSNSCSIAWVEPENGGYFSAKVGKVIVTSGWSGGRPIETAGFSAKDYEQPEWEKTLGEWDAYLDAHPEPDASESSY